MRARARTQDARALVADKPAENETARTRALPEMEGVTRGADGRSRIATRNFSALLRALRHEMIGDGTAVGAAQAFGRLCGGLRKATAAHHAEDCWHFGLSGVFVCRGFRVWPYVD